MLDMADSCSVRMLLGESTNGIVVEIATPSLWQNAMALISGKEASDPLKATLDFPVSNFQGLCWLEDIIALCIIQQLPQRLKHTGVRLQKRLWIFPYGIFSGLSIGECNENIIALVLLEYCRFW
jgi:hypothetical protein